MSAEPHFSADETTNSDALIDRQTYMAAGFLLAVAGLVFTIAGGTRLFVPKDCQLHSRAVLTQSGNQATATSRGGAPCLISAHNNHADVEALEIVTPPSNGRIVTRGKTGLVYVPNLQFKGTDSFDMRVIRRNRPSSSDAKIISMTIDVD